METNRTRIIFYIIVGLALLVVCIGVSFTLLRGMLEEATPTLVAVVETRPVEQTPSTPVVQLESPDPIFAPGYDPSDGLPTYICGADAFGSYFTLQQMQMSGKDVEHGFHLGIVPFLLDDNPDYDISEEQRTALLNSGQWDCLLTTLASIASATLSWGTRVTSKRGLSRAIERV